MKYLAVKRESDGAIVPIKGTLERIYGCAEVDAESDEEPKKDANGQWDLSYSGGTDVFWDGQMTVTDPNGERIFMDHDDNQYPESKVFLADDKEETTTREKSAV